MFTRITISKAVNELDHVSQRNKGSVNLIPKRILTWSSVLECMKLKKYYYEITVLMTGGIVYSLCVYELFPNLLRRRGQ